MVGIIDYFSEFHIQAAIEAMKAAIPMITDDEFNNMLSEGFDTKNGDCSVCNCMCGCIG